MNRDLKANCLFIAALTILWLVMIFITNPVGDFPLNDDWMYARSVFYLITQGKYKVTEAYSPILIAQVGWGYLLCLFKGFSFTALRISTLVLGLVGIYVFYFLVNTLTKNKRLSFFSVLILMINPLYFSLSSSFMTDVPFLTLILISIFFFFRAIQTHDLKDILVATIFSILATLIRQLAIVIPMTYGIVISIKKDQNIKEKIRNFIPAILTVLVLVVALVWLNSIHSGIKFFQSASVKPLFKSIFSKLYIRTGYVLVYAGIFLFPLVLFITNRSFKGLTAFHKKRIGVLVLCLIPAFILVYRQFPCNNMVNNGFIGPHTMRDAYVLHLPELFTFPPAVLFTVFLFGVVGAVMVIINIWAVGIKVYAQYKSPSDLFAKYSGLLFVALCVIGYCALIFPPDLFIDRYTLPCIALIWLIICTEEFERIKPAIYVFNTIYVCAIAYFTIASTHDWLEWNRARWKGVEYVTKEKNIPADKLDAGYEDNGWLLGGEFSTHKDKTWWFVDDNEYMLSMQKVAGYQTIKQFNYTNYFPCAQRSLLVLQKQQ